MFDFQFFDFLIVGNISTEFIIDLHNHSHQNVIGGSALYAAGGLRCWSDRIAILSHCDVHHRDSLEKIRNTFKVGIDGVQFHLDFIDDRIFLGYITPYEAKDENPTAFYASRNLPFPKDLIGYSRNHIDEHGWNEIKFLPKDIPARYREISATLLCPSSISAQLQLSSMLQKASTNIMVIQASDQYMKMSNFETMPILLKGVTAFITTSSQLSNLFQNRSHDHWEMAEHLCSLGCEYIVFGDGRFGHYLYDRQTQKRVHLPPYPVDLVDPTGMEESFCGGFISGIKRTFDPVEALINGMVSASFTAEGTGPFYGVDAIPGLLTSRYKFAREFLKFI